MRRPLLVLPSALALLACAHTRSPAAAMRLERHAEELHDACSAGDWARARDATDEARSTWLDEREAARKDGASPALVGMVDTALPLAESAVDRRARRSCASDATALSLATSHLEGSDRDRLGAWLRRLDMDAQYRDFDAAARDVRYARDAWSRVRPTTSAATQRDVDAAIAASEGADDERAMLPLRHAAHAAMAAMATEARRPLP